MDRQYIIARTDGETAATGLPELQMEHILWEPDCGIRAKACVCHDLCAVHLAVCSGEYRYENFRSGYCAKR